MIYQFALICVGIIFIGLVSFELSFWLSDIFSRRRKKFKSSDGIFTAPVSGEYAVTMIDTSQGRADKKRKYLKRKRQ